MNDEPLGVHRQSDGIVDQRKRNQRQQRRQSQQHDTDFPDVTVHRIQQVLRIIDFNHLLVRLNLILYPRDTVRIRIIRVQFDFDRCRKRVMSQKLRRVRAHRLRLLLQRLSLRDIRSLLHIRLLVQPFLEVQNIRFLHVIAHQHRERDILAHIHRQVVGSHHEEDHYPQQEQHQHRTDARRHKLHIKERPRFSAHSLIFF